MDQLTLAGTLRNSGYCARGWLVWFAASPGSSTPPSVTQASIGDDGRVTSVARNRISDLNEALPMEKWSTFLDAYNP